MEPLDSATNFYTGQPTDMQIVGRVTVQKQMFGGHSATDVGKQASGEERWAPGIKKQVRLLTEQIFTMLRKKAKL